MTTLFYREKYGSDDDVPYWKNYMPKKEMIDYLDDGQYPVWTTLMIISTKIWKDLQRYHDDIRSRLFVLKQELSLNVI